MEKKIFDVAVIGSGPGGYVAAIRAQQHSLSTCLIEVQDTGGTCLNRGCIPSKALIASASQLSQLKEAENHGIHIKNVSFDYGIMRSRKEGIVHQIRGNLEGLIKKHGVTMLRGYGKFLSPHQIKVLGEEECIVEAKQIIIATGSEPKGLPFVSFDQTLIHDSTSLLEIQTLPKSLIIVGGGIIGCEFASLYNALGVEVTIIELLPSILSTEGTQIADIMTQAFQKKGMKIYTNASITRLDTKSDHVVAHLADGATLYADIALISVGRKYNTENISLEKAGVILNPNGSIDTNEHMQTNVPHIYAIGDITGKWLLAHVASHQGLVAADTAAGVPNEMHYNAVPSVIFTSPEVATVGYTLDRALKAGYDAVAGAFPFQALGKSQAIGETEGFAQIITSKSTGQILGAQVIGHDAATLIAEMALAISAELTVASIAETIHAHPTLPESWMEASLLASGLPLHLPPKRTK
jgi:dihydrolipoamide dehydrogenase